MADTTAPGIAYHPLASCRLDKARCSHGCWESSSFAPFVAGKRTVVILRATLDADHVEAFAVYAHVGAFDVHIKIHRPRASIRASGAFHAVAPS